MLYSYYASNSYWSKLLKAIIRNLHNMNWPLLGPSLPSLPNDIIITFDYLQTLEEFETNGIGFATNPALN